MAIDPGDFNLHKFLKKFTYQGDSDPRNKIEIPINDFLNIGSLLRISLDLVKLRAKLK